MSLRFRKSFKLAPGIRMNLSGSGVSWTVGPRGASVGIGRRGAHLNSGIPGTGLYARTPLGGTSQSRAVSSSAPQTRNVQMRVSLEDDGTLKFFGEDGQPAREWLVDEAKKQRGDEIRGMMQRAVDDINASVESLGRIHRYTPSPDQKPTYEPIPFQEPPPEKPKEREPGLLDRMLSSRARAIETENAARLAAFEEELAAWQKRKEAHDASEAQQRMLIEQLIYRAAPAMEIYLEQVLQDIVWPRETSVTFEVSDDLQRIQLALDLPEIEDLPKKTASLPSNRWKATIKELGDGKLRKLYMAHVHGVGFRVIGEAFAALPTLQEVIVSAFSQRPDASTGHVRDEYLYSVRVRRSDWTQLNFQNLESIDVVEALAAFEIRRNMSKTGVFKGIEPITA